MILKQIKGTSGRLNREGVFRKKFSEKEKKGASCDHVFTTVRKYLIWRPFPKSAWLNEFVKFRWCKKCFSWWIEHRFLNIWTPLPGQYTRCKMIDIKDGTWFDYPKYFKMRDGWKWYIKNFQLENSEEECNERIDGV